MLKTAMKHRFIIVSLVLIFVSLFATAANLTAHFIDVGQGDSIFIQTPNDQTLLIDAGPRSKGKLVVKYLKDLGVEVIDAIVATHPHEDHIGGFPEVFESFTVKNVYFTNQEHTTKTFENFLLAVNGSGAKRIRAVYGRSIEIDPEVKIDILSPFDKRYKDLNHSSVVLRITYGDTSFLFTGDSEVPNEDELLEKGVHLGADVLKVAHHGSRTSSSMPFLTSVSPSIAVILCGKGNSYGHPNQEVLQRLKELNVEVLRTDLLGTIVIQSDGKKITKLSN